MTCDRCGKNLDTPDDACCQIPCGLSFPAMGFKKGADYESYLKAQYGKHDYTRDYNFCVECVLDTFIKQSKQQTYTWSTQTSGATVGSILNGII